MDKPTVILTAGLAKLNNLQHSHELLETEILKDRGAAGKSFSAFSLQTGLEILWALICSEFCTDLITQEGIEILTNHLSYSGNKAYQ